jgi:uroporphyrinogen-III synthase
MPDPAEPGALSGLLIVTFESRRAEELRRMLERHGAEVWSAPALREVPIEENPAAVELLAELEAGRIDVTILLTGVGTDALARALASRCPPERLATLLRRTRLVARGPKPVAALRRLGLVPEVVAPEPNTWRELLAALDSGVELRGRRVVVQEYGRKNPELLAALAERGAEVRSVPVYRWALPEDRGPLLAGIERLCMGRADVAVFTTAVQIDHVIRVTSASDVAELRRALAERVLVASIGPTATEALASHGLEVDLQPAQPKLGPLVAMLAREAGDRLARKRATTAASAHGASA